MKAWVRQLAVHLNGSYWFIPALMTLLALVLAIGTVIVDVIYGSRWLSELTWLDISRPDGARELLSSIAGSMIGVAGTVFSITIAAVVYASGSYGPRLLTNFMTDRGNQFSLGVFIATFVYCLMVLRTVRVGDSDLPGFVPELSVLVALILALFAVAVLVFFLHHVPDSIRINGVVARIGQRLLHDVKERYPDERPAPEPERVPRVEGRAVFPHRTGYIQIIDHDTLRDVAEEHGLYVWLSVRTGDFVHPHVELMQVTGEGDHDHALRRAFAIGDSRTAEQDLEYLIDELVEIGVRALSPGINDPFTAITCLHWLGAAMSSLARRDLCNDGDGRPYGERRVHALADDFDHYLRRGHGSARSAVATNDLAAAAFVDSLVAAAADCVNADRRRLMAEEALRMVEQAQTALAGPSLAAVEERGRHADRIVKGQG